ncbi:MAG: RagB/SusD family nutrient uptake outer membrane protein [Moheibacter sp.]
MKKIFKYLMTAALAFGFVSCDSDDLEQLPPGSAIYEFYFQSPEEFESAIRGAYMSFFSSGFYTAEGGIVKIGDVLADNVVFNPGGRGTSFIGHNWLYDSGSGAPTGIYSGAFQMITRVNAILANIDNLEDADFPNKAQIKAEALALRGIAHFEVARHYVKIPTQGADANSYVGIPYVTEFDPYQEPARLATVADVYAKIFEDLEAALPDIPASSENIFRLNQNSYKGILSRIYLYAGNYDKVIEYATPVVAAVAPAPSASLKNLWRSNDQSGVLFSTLVDLSDPVIGINYSQGTGPTMVVEYSVDKAFYDLFNPSTEKDRMDATIGKNNSLNLYFVNKYMQSIIGFGSHYGRYMRVEEVILNLAEAQYLKHQEGAALTTLNKLRDARYSSYSGGESGDALFDAIQLERRKELAFETGDRWFTLKRLQGVPNIPAVYHQGVQRSGNGEHADGSGTPPVNLNLAPDAREWQFPITQSHMIRNPNMTQTPGY